LSVISQLTPDKTLDPSLFPLLIFFVGCVEDEKGSKVTDATRAPAEVAKAQSPCHAVTIEISSEQANAWNDM
jgi:hypothetical protein